MAKKGGKIAAAAVCAAVAVTGGMFGGAALMRNSAQQQIEQSKQEWQDKGYQEGLKVNVGYTEEQMQQAKDQVRQEEQAKAEKEKEDLRKQLEDEKQQAIDDALASTGGTSTTPKLDDLQLDTSYINREMTVLRASDGSSYIYTDVSDSYIHTTLDIPSYDGWQGFEKIIDVVDGQETSKAGIFFNIVDGVAESKDGANIIYLNFETQESRELISYNGEHGSISQMFAQHTEDGIPVVVLEITNSNNSKNVYKVQDGQLVNLFAQGNITVEGDVEFQMRYETKEVACTGSFKVSSEGGVLTYSTAYYNLATGTWRFGPLTVSKTLADGKQLVSSLDGEFKGVFLVEDGVYTQLLAEGQNYDFVQEVEGGFEFTYNNGLKVDEYKNRQIYFYSNETGEIESRHSKVQLCATNEEYGLSVYSYDDNGRFSYALFCEGTKYICSTMSGSSGSLSSIEFEQERENFYKITIDANMYGTITKVILGFDKSTGTFAEYSSFQQ